MANGEKKWIGKTILVGLTFLNRQGNLLDRYETYGTIEDIVEGSIRIARKEGPFQLPPSHEEYLQEAQPGVYQERTSGATVTNPDYIADVRITVKDESKIEECKKYGYVRINTKNGRI